MQRSFVTEMPDQLEPNQVVVDLPRYELPLAKALFRGQVQNATRFATDDGNVNVVTTLNMVKAFVDALGEVDTEMDIKLRVPYTNYEGLHFQNAGQAVAWARRFVAKYWPVTEERLLKRQLLTLPLDKTEIVWAGGDKYLGFVQAVATAPSTDELVKANSPSVAPAAPQLTMEEVKRKRAEIAARRAAKSGTMKPEANNASDN